MTATTEAYKRHKDQAHEAMTLFRALCDYPVPRVPGCDTVIRLAWRIECGTTTEQAALREYAYRMRLAATVSPIFGAPSLLGA